MHRMDVRILDARLHDTPPVYGTAGAAGLDLRACLDAPLTLKPGRQYSCLRGLPFIWPIRGWQP